MISIRTLGYGLAFIFFSIGVAGLGSVALDIGKSVLAAPLLDRAFSKAQSTGIPQKPWSWADHTVIGQLTFEATSETITTLDSGGMRAMAFAPVSYPQGSAVVLVAHRDTHFKSLKSLRLGDTLHYQKIGQRKRRYEVADTWIADKDQLYLPEGGYTAGLLLITCYPFDKAEAGGRQRLLVWAPEVDPEVDPEIVMRSAQTAAKPPLNRQKAPAG